MTNLTQSQSGESISANASNTTVGQNPAVTVIVPSYNYAHFIGQTIESVQAQTFANWECVIVDDGSTDNTREVVAAYQRRDARIRYVNQPNKGLPAARNTGLRAATGALIQFLDSDDLIEARKLEKHVEFLNQRPEVDIVYGDARFFRTENPEERLRSWEDDEAWMPQIREDTNALNALIQQVIVVNAPLTRRSAIDQVGWFDETMKACEDWHFWIRCAAHGKRFYYLEEEETLALIRRHPASMSRDDLLMTEQLVSMRMSVATLINDRKIRQLNQSLASDYLGYGGARQIQAGNLSRGIRQMLRAGAMSVMLRGCVKWFFCALVAPLVPRREFDKFISTPAHRSLLQLVKRPFHA